MPPLSTHFRLATLVMPLLGITTPQVSYFFLGTIAPDAFDPESEENFSRHHFKGKDGRISLEHFLKETNFIFEPSNNSSWSLSCGYYSHLWLDAFYRDNADRLPIKKPIGISDIDLRSLVRRETEILNAPCVLDIGNLLSLQFEDLSLPVGLQFVELERCFHLFHEVLKQSQAWSQFVPTFESIDEGEYTSFFENLSKIFRNEIRNAA
ncbi:MAG: hypothetical protein MUO77_18245 [Anaerolineales bacterium]|nr:hypothetical protein [Anaerolineales bacterium]